MPTIRAMVLEALRQPLRERALRAPLPGRGQVTVRVRACAVCRTDLHILDGELLGAKLPLVLGHEIVGDVDGVGEGVHTLKRGDRIGIPWLGWTCGRCPQCLAGRENLCERARFTGFHIDGGFTEYTVADARFVIPLPRDAEPAYTAPLLCAGLIGWRTLKAAGSPDDAQCLGIYGFGAAAHIVTQVARSRGQRVFAFTRAGDEAGQRFARELGAEWAGASDARPPQELDAALIFAPVGSLVPTALRAVRPGGTVVCGGIHMSDIPSFPYSLLWGERVVRSVANLTRSDGSELFALAPTVPIRTTIERWPLREANEALDALRDGSVEGAAVLTMDD